MVAGADDVDVRFCALRILVVFDDDRLVANSERGKKLNNETGRYDDRSSLRCAIIILLPER